MAEFRVTGLRETIKKFESLGVEISDLKQSMTRIGTLVSNEIKQLAPVDTGALVASVRPAKAKNKAIVRAGSARVDYAQYQDRGYKGIAGKKFMQRGLEAKKDDVVRQLDQELRGLIEKYDL